MRRWLLASLSALAVAALVGCGSSSADPTATPVPPTPVPPTSTPIALTLPRLIGQYLNGAQVTSLDTFETLDPGVWSYSPEWVTTSDNEAQILGEADWAAYLDRTSPVGEGSAVYFRFRVDPNAEYGIYFDSATWDTPQYKRFGLYGPIAETNVFHGITAGLREEFDGSLVVEPDVWYDLLLAVGPDAEFAAVVWNPDDPEQRQTWQGIIDHHWNGQTWNFGITANNGYLWIDDFAVLTFSELDH